MRPLCLRVINWFNAIVKSEHVNDDVSGKALVAYVLIFGGAMLSFTATLVCLVGPYFSKERYGVSVATPALTLLLFAILYFLCRSGKITFVAYILIGLNLIFGVYLSARWGIDVPESLIIYALTIVMSSMLTSPRFAFFTTVGISAIIYILFFLARSGYLETDSGWRSDPVLIVDAIIYTASLGVIYLVGWLSNTQVEKSLKRAKVSETELKKERDSLEIKVEERTDELKKSQVARMEQLDRFIEFGKLSSGIFHDLTNYLNVFMLYFEKAESIDENDVIRVKDYLEEFKSAKDELHGFIEASRRQLQNAEPLTWFSPAEEIKNVIRVFSYISKKVGVTVNLSLLDEIKIMGDPIKFSHIITSVVSNAIDSYDGISDMRERVVAIDMSVACNRLIFSIKDNGCGIPKENLDKIFDAFYTTKDPERGTGLGLAISKDLITKDFGGEVMVKSALNDGSTFIIKIPFSQ